MNILSLHSCHHVRRKGDRPAGPFFLFFLLLLRWLSWEKASAAFCSRATKISMSSRAQLRICCSTQRMQRYMAARGCVLCKDNRARTQTLTTSFSMRWASFSCDSVSFSPETRLSTSKRSKACNYTKHVTMKEYHNLSTCVMCAGTLGVCGSNSSLGSM